jgi:hypothetical protein
LRRAVRRAKHNQNREGEDAQEKDFHAAPLAEIFHIIRVCFRHSFIFEISAPTKIAPVN